MCSAFMSGIPMYVAGSPPSIVATWLLPEPEQLEEGDGGGGVGHGDGDVVGIAEHVDLRGAERERSEYRIASVCVRPPSHD